MVEETRGWPLWCSSRLALTIVGFLGFVNLYALRVDMSVAIVCMTTLPETNTEPSCMMGNMTSSSAENTSLTLTNSSTDCPSVKADIDPNYFDWNKQTQGLILGSFFWGYILTQLLGGWLAGRYGGKNLFGWSMFVCALATVLVPVAANVGIGAVIFARVVAGLCQGVVWPAMHTLLANWCPPLERSKLSGFVFAGCQIGNVITFPLSGLLCQYGFAGGWPSIFYVFGGLGLLWFVLWMLIVADTPLTHTRISEGERHYIVSSQGTEIDVSKKSTHTPWREIFTSLPVWAIIVTHACSNWGTYTFMTNIPSYMKDVLKFDIKKTGYLTALPYIGFWAMTNVSGQVADWLRKNNYATTTTSRKLFNSLGTFVPALFIIITGHMDMQPWAAVVFLTVGVAMSGCQYGSGFIVNPVDVAPRYAGIIFGISNTTGTLGGFLAPITIGYITRNRTKEQWQYVFYLAAAIYVVGAVFYILFGSGEVQQWAMEKDAVLTCDGQESAELMQTKQPEANGALPNAENEQDDDPMCTSDVEYADKE